MTSYTLEDRALVYAIRQTDIFGQPLLALDVLRESAMSPGHTLDRMIQVALRRACGLFGEWLEPVTRFYDQVMTAEVLPQRRLVEVSANLYSTRRRMLETMSAHEQEAFEVAALSLLWISRLWDREPLLAEAITLWDARRSMPDRLPRDIMVAHFQLAEHYRLKSAIIDYFEGKFGNKPKHAVDIISRRTRFAHLTERLWLAGEMAADLIECGHETGLEGRVLADWLTQHNQAGRAAILQAVYHPQRIIATDKVNDEINRYRWPDLDPPGELVRCPKCGTMLGAIWDDDRFHCACGWTSEVQHV